MSSKLYRFSQVICSDACTLGALEVVLEVSPLSGCALHRMEACV